MRSDEIEIDLSELAEAFPYYTGFPVAGKPSRPYAGRRSPRPPRLWHHAKQAVWNAITTPRAHHRHFRLTGCHGAMAADVLSAFFQECADETSVLVDFGLPNLWQSPLPDLFADQTVRGRPGRRIPREVHRFIDSKWHMAIALKAVLRERLTHDPEDFSQSYIRHVIQWQRQLAGIFVSSFGMKALPELPAEIPTENFLRLVEQQAEVYDTFVLLILQNLHRSHFPAPVCIVLHNLDSEQHCAVLRDAIRHASAAVQRLDGLLPVSHYHTHFKFFFQSNHRPDGDVL